jgi:uncharacterized protein YbjT (DUF2867 family)
MAPIHEKDIAGVAVRALLDQAYRRKRHILTGPESLTLVQQVKVIGSAIGRPLHFVEVSPEVARPEMLELMPRDIVDVLLEVLPRLTAGPASVTNTVREITGATHTFREWASDHAADFR